MSFYLWEGGREPKSTINSKGNYEMKKFYKQAAIALAVIAVNSGANVLAKEKGAVEYNLEPQPLTAALQEFSKQSGLQIGYDSALATGLRSNGVIDATNPDAALESILAGTGLSYQFIDDSTVVIKVNSDTDAAESGALKSRDSESLEKNRVLEEVIVTATKRAVSLQDVPVAVSALTTQDVEKQGIENFEDFARQLPGVNLIQPRKNRSQFIIRGITTGQAGSRSQDEVATYINDISVTSSYFASVLPDLRLFDVERIEVLRGPQGTLFGSGSLGGAVRVITNKPDASSFDSAGMLDTGYTKGGATRSRYSGMVNIPLIDDELAVRAVGYYRDEEGYIENIGTGVDKANSTVDWGGRIAVEWRPTERLKASLLVMAQDSTPEDDDQIDPTLGKYKKSSVASGELISELRVYNATIDYDLGFATLTSSTTSTTSLGSSFGGLNFITDLTARFGQDSTFTSEEIKLVSQSDGPFEWVVGGYYFDQTADQWEFLAIQDPITFAQQFNVTGVPADGNIGSILSTLDAKEKALFGELSYQLNDQFTLTGGLRYSKSNMHFVNLNGIGRVGGFVVAALSGGGDINDFPPAIFDQDVSADSSVLTGKASISYQPNDDQTFYLQASRGYRVGQANTAQGPDPIDPVNGLNIPSQFKPDSLWNYELGAKTTLLDGRLTANLALFYIPWDNIQVAGARQTDFVTFTGNAGEAVSKGIELETVFLPADGLQMGLNITYQDAKITDISAQDSAVTGVVDGDKLPNSPDFQIAGYAEYTWPVRNNWEMFARLDMQYVDSAINGFSNQSGAPGVPLPGLMETDAYENVNSSFGLQAGDWRFTFYVENLTDNDDFIYIQPTVFTGNKYNVLRPRTVGIRLKYDY